MGEKMSTIVLKVDLECQRCYKKIRRVICKIQDKMNIKTISFDEKSNSVTISGPFDAEEVCNKLCCQAGRVIKEVDIVKGKEVIMDGGDSNKAVAKKPVEKDGGKPEKAGKAGKDGKAEKDGKAGKDGKAEKDGKVDKEAKPAEKKEVKPAPEKEEAKPDKEEPKGDDKPEKKVKFAGDDAAPARAAPKADLGPLLEKIMAGKTAAWPEPPRGEPITSPPPAVPTAQQQQGVAVQSIWPAPASSMAGYGYAPSSHDQPSYYGACACGYGGGYCRCGNPAAPGGYYGGVPVYDDQQGWYYGGHRQPYHPQQPCGEEPDAGCSVM